MYHSGHKLINPYLLFEKARLAANMQIADFGCGDTGHLVFPAAKIVGEDGLVYALDILKAVLETIGKRARQSNFTQVHPVWSDMERVGGAAIPQNSLDIVFFVNSLFHCENKINPLLEAKRLLKNKARLLVVDWKKNHGLPIGAQGDQTINFDSIINWGKKNNFALQEKFPSGKYHSGIVLYRHD